MQKRLKFRPTSPACDSRPRYRLPYCARRWTDSRSLSILDGDLGIQYSGPKPIGDAGSAVLDGAAYADSPSTPLTATLNAKSADESFELYLMYKPDGADSIWVTLGMGTWTWAGRTTRITTPPGTNWTAAAAAGMSKHDGANSTVLPVWTTQFSSMRWV
ncbi:MAG: hypothetical protein IPK83_24690 [Planctomycetes bacterium]|nr:hypothetical protein [Planctomycetota bacterium]